MSLRRRGFAAIVGLGLLTALVLAGSLRPDPRGLGTHEQLGLPPCALKMLAGLRCPACGMTTSWAHAARGQLADAVRAHVGGTMLAVGATIGSAVALTSALRGQWTVRLPSETAMISLLAVGTAILCGEWLVRLWAG